MSPQEAPQGVVGNLRPLRDPEAAHATSYSLLRALIAASPDGDGADAAMERGRLWRAMRVLREFDVALVRITALAAEDRTEAFAAALVASGHLERVDPPGAEWPRYRVRPGDSAKVPGGDDGRG